MRRPPLRLCGGAAGSTGSTPLGLGTIARMDSRVALGVYFLIAAVAAFVTAARTLPLPLLFAVLVALGIVAALMRSRVLGLGGTTRATVGFVVIYVVTFAVIVLLRR